MPSGGFTGTSEGSYVKKHGYSSDCQGTNCKKSDASDVSSTADVTKNGFYFQISEDNTAQDSYIYEYMNYRATVTDFYISGKIFVTGRYGCKYKLFERTSSNFF